MASRKSSPAGGAIDVKKLKSFVDKYTGFLSKRADVNGDIRALLNQADDAGFDKKAVEAVGRRKNKNRGDVLGHERKVHEYEVALGFQTADMFDDPPATEDAAATAKAEAAGDPADDAPKPYDDGKKPKTGKSRATRKRKAKANGAEVENFAFEAGRKAAAEGWARTKNPYKRDQGQQAKWDEGWESQTMADDKAAKEAKEADPAAAPAAESQEQQPVS